MDDINSIINNEENRLESVLTEMRKVLSEETSDCRGLNDELVKLKQEKLAAESWREKNEIEEEIGKVRERMATRSYQSEKALRKPYFGVLCIDDDDLGKLTYCIGPATLFGRSGRAIAIDWRDAPISRLYYEYEAGEEYDEEIRNRERSGRIVTKRQTDIDDGILKTIKEKDLLITKNGNGKWQQAEDTEPSASARKEAKKDHRLPEITALIGKDQFKAITTGASGTFILKGGAGSGKTTVGLHRIAYLMFQEPKRFLPRTVLVVMFNKALEGYISKVLPDLGIDAGVLVSTYHKWAGDIFNAAGVNCSYTKTLTPETVTRIKKDSRILQLIDLYIQRLVTKSKSWYLDKTAGDPSAAMQKKRLEAVTTMPDLMALLHNQPEFSGPQIPEQRAAILDQLKRRLNDHLLDLHSALTDQELFEQVFHEKPETHKHFAALAQRQSLLKSKGEMDFSDTGILIYILQKKGVWAALPEYSHVMVDEAQDLSLLELATLIHAADTEKCVTICGDMAQQIKTDVSRNGGQGFDQLIPEVFKNSRVGSIQTLAIGYRATRQIMELAWHVIGSPKVMDLPRSGDPVGFIRTTDAEETAAKIQEIACEFIAAQPHGILGIVCKYKNETEALYNLLKPHLAALRLHKRDGFDFKPGVILTNAHQVKGLEFSAVIVANPSVRQYRSSKADRMLLHVVLTRASERLWIIGHEEFAYGIAKQSLTG